MIFSTQWPTHYLLLILAKFSRKVNRTVEKHKYEVGKNNDTYSVTRLRFS